jgi:hypothetical protein
MMICIMAETCYAEHKESLDITLPEARPTHTVETDYIRQTVNVSNIQYSTATGGPIRALDI